MADLLGIFGDAAPALRRLTRAHKEILPALIEAKPEMRHAISAALLVGTSPDLPIVELINTNSPTKLMEFAIGPKSKRCAAVFKRLGGKALTAEQYKALIDLAREPLGRQLTHHPKPLTRRQLDALQQVPEAYRDACFLKFKDFVSYARHLRNLFQAIETACPGTTQPDMLGSLRTTRLNTLAQWAPHFLQSRAEFPRIPEIATDRITQILSGVELVRAAQEFSNCLRGWFTNILQKYIAFGVYRDESGKAVIEFRQWHGFGWYASDIHAVKNARMNKVLLTSVQNHLADCGVFMKPKDACLRHDNPFDAIGLC